MTEPNTIEDNVLMRMIISNMMYFISNVRNEAFVNFDLYIYIKWKQDSERNVCFYFVIQLEDISIRDGALACLRDILRKISETKNNKMIIENYVIKILLPSIRTKIKNDQQVGIAIHLSMLKND